MSQLQNVSDDLVWEIVRPNNAFLVKRKSGGGVQFSRDPFNLVNKHSRTHAGFVNSKAVAIQANGSKGVIFQTKRAGKANTPKSAANSSTFKAGRSSRSTYRAVASQVGKNSYRSDLNQSAVQRASAILESQRPKPDTPEKKTRGSKNRKAQA